MFFLLLGGEEKLLLDCSVSYQNHVNKSIKTFRYHGGFPNVAELSICFMVKYDLLEMLVLSYWNGVVLGYVPKRVRFYSSLILMSLLGGFLRVV